MRRAESQQRHDVPPSEYVSKYACFKSRGCLLNAPEADTQFRPLIGSPRKNSSEKGTAQDKRLRCEVDLRTAVSMAEPVAAAEQAVVAAAAAASRLSTAKVVSDAKEKTRGYPERIAIAASDPSLCLAESHLDKELVGFGTRTVGKVCTCFVYAQQCMFIS